MGSPKKKRAIDREPWSAPTIRGHKREKDPAKETEEDPVI